MMFRSNNPSHILRYHHPSSTLNNCHLLTQTRLMTRVHLPNTGAKVGIDGKVILERVGGSALIEALNGRQMNDVVTGSLGHAQLRFPRREWTQQLGNVRLGANGGQRERASIVFPGGERGRDRGENSLARLKHRETKTITIPWQPKQDDGQKSPRSNREKKFSERRSEPTW